MMNLFEAERYIRSNGRRTRCSHRGGIPVLQAWCDRGHAFAPVSVIIENPGCQPTVDGECVKLWVYQNVKLPQIIRDAATLKASGVS